MKLLRKPNSRRKSRLIRDAGAVSAPSVAMSAPSVKIPPSQAATPAARAAQTDFARQADGVNTARIMRNGDGSITAESGFGNGTKKYNAEQIKWIMSRGASGGSLSRQDQAVYDRMMWMRANDAAKAQKAEEEEAALDAAHAEDERKRRLDAEEWDRQNKIRFDQAQAAAKQSQDAQIAEEQRRNAEYDRRTKDERDYKAQQQQAALDAENAKYEELNKRYGIDAGTRLSEKDYNDLAAGRTKWGYSQRDQADVDKINQSYDDSVRSGRFSADELAKLRAESDAKIAAYRKGVQSNDQPPTAEQIYNGAFKGPDGTLYVADGKGGISPIKGTEPREPKETPEQKLEAKRKEYILGQVEAARKSWQTKMDAYDPQDPNAVKPEDFNQQGVLDAATANWNAVYGAPSAPSTQTGEPSIAGGVKQNVQAGANAISDWRKALGW